MGAVTLDASFPMPVQLITNSRKLGMADYRATISYDLLSARGNATARENACLA